MTGNPPETTSPPIQPPLRLRVQLPTRASFLANGVHQLELILQYGALEEHVLMIDIHGHLGLQTGQTQDEPAVVGVSHNFVTINSLPPPTSNNEDGSGGESSGWRNKCHFCSKRFMTQSLLRHHLIIHTGGGDRPHPCEQCGKKFNLKHNLTRHQRLHYSADPATQRPFHCAECDKSFTTNYNLTTHVKVVHLRLKQFQCPQCGRKFGQRSALRTHLNSFSIRHPCGRPTAESLSQALPPSANQVPPINLTTSGYI